MTSAPAFTDQYIFQKSVLFSLSFTFLLWAIKALEWSTATNLGTFGILPRTLAGAVGIFTAPLIHGDTMHLLSNTFPLLLLMLAVFYFYYKIAWEVFLWIYLITGFWVWLAARQAYHIGSSGLVYGLAAFLFFSGIFRRDVRSVVIALCIAFLYGGMVQGVLPTAGGVSWESHLLGAAAGVMCSFYFRRTDRDKTAEEQVPGADESVLPNTNSTFTHHSFRSDSDTVYVYSLKETSTSDPFVCYTYTENSSEDITASET